jgi:hypothetical protein
MLAEGTKSSNIFTTTGIAVSAAVLVLALAGFAIVTTVKDSILRDSDRTPRGERLAIYREILSGWLDDGKGKVYLQVQADPLFLSEPNDRNCEAELDLESASNTEIGRFRKGDLSFLGVENLVLLEPGQSGVGEPNLRLSEIRFDKAHRQAIVAFSYSCNQNCSRVQVAFLEKQNGQWKRTRDCIDSNM